MPLTLELPHPLEEELSLEAQREGVSPVDHAILLLYLVTALLRESDPTPFQETVRSFLARRSLNADQIASVFEELVRLCLETGKEGVASSPLREASKDPIGPDDLALLKKWRNSLVHGVNAASAIPVSSGVPPVVGRQARKSDGQHAKSNEESPRPQERDPVLVARVRNIRGRLALPAEAGLASEDLHRERQRDKEKEEEQIRGHQP